MSIILRVFCAFFKSTLNEAGNPNIDNNYERKWLLSGEFL